MKDGRHRACPRRIYNTFCERPRPREILVSPRETRVVPRGCFASGAEMPPRSGRRCGRSTPRYCRKPLLKRPPCRRVASAGRGASKVVICGSGSGTWSSCATILIFFSISGSRRFGGADSRGRSFCRNVGAGADRAAALFCFLKTLSEVRMLTTFYIAKSDHRRVSSISLKRSSARASVDSGACFR